MAGMTRPHFLFDLRRRDPGWESDPNIQGIPQIRAEKLIPPTPFQLTESESVWKELVVSRAIRLYVPNQRRILRAVPLHLRGDTPQNIISRGLFVPSVDGYLDLAPGTWQINTPIVTVEGAKVEAVYHDAVFAVGSGVIETGVPAGSTPGAASTVTVGVASTVILAASATRQRYVVSVPVGGNSVWVAYGAAAVVGAGQLIAPGGALHVEPNEWAHYELRGIADGAAQDVGVQVWT